MTNPPSRSSAQGAGYGARPVSIDLARSQRLCTSAMPEKTAVFNPDPLIAAQPGQTLRHPERSRDRSSAVDQLGLASWPPSHRVFICGLTGGAGRTTVAGLIAATVGTASAVRTERSVALGEMNPSRWSGSSRRWGTAEDGRGIELTIAGARLRLVRTFGDSEDGFPVLVIDTSADLTACLPAISEQQASSVVLVSRPDCASLHDTAQALAWLNDQGLVQRAHLTVVVNDGAGPSDRGSRAAAATLGMRASSVHRLSQQPALGPGCPLPSVNQTPRAIRKVLIDLCLDLRRSSVHSYTDSPSTTL